MKWCISILVAVLAALTTDAGAVPPRCLATPVHGGTVRAGPFVGDLTTKYDVVGGRFRLHVGEYRNRKDGLSQKIAWVAPRTAKIGDWLVVTGRRLRPTPLQFVERWARAADPDNLFPSNISPPAAGCWRLTFTSGQAHGALTALVTP